MADGWSKWANKTQKEKQRDVSHSLKLMEYLQLLLFYAGMPVLFRPP